MSIRYKSKKIKIKIDEEITVPLHEFDVLWGHDDILVSISNNANSMMPVVVMSHDIAINVAIYKSDMLGGNNVLLTNY